MNIAVAQTQPVAGNIEKNIEHHKRLIERAVSKKADVIFFPELSITGYEPRLAGQLATHQDDPRFDEFQTISDTENIIIGIGVPTRGDTGILISMLIFQPDQARLTYSKQQLHSDEFPYFVNGQGQVIVTTHNTRIAPAICYESLQPDHAEHAVRSGAEMYVASVAKSANGVVKAFRHFPEIAKQYSMPVLMSNCVGPCDDFESVGNSAIWNRDGLLLGQLNETEEGVLLFDTETEQVMRV